MSFTKLMPTMVVELSTTTLTNCKMQRLWDCSALSNKQTLATLVNQWNIALQF